jgi:hypothetical protein
VSPEETLRRVIEILEKHKIPYMLTGSVAASYHGRPRATHDADLVIDPTPQQLDQLVADLDAAAFYVDGAGARAALEQRRQFNAIDTQSASKVDLIVRKERPYSLEELARRQYVDLSFDRPVAMVTPEDAILSKLEWAQRSGDSVRQLRDAAGVLELNPGVDRMYIERWAIELGVFEMWQAISKHATPSPEQIPRE